MQQKPENNLKEYTEFLDCPQQNKKESTFIILLRKFYL